jgi:plasmid stability protein
MLHQQRMSYWCIQHVIMIVTLYLPADVEAAMRADAEAQGFSAEAVATEPLTAFYEHENAEPEPEAVAVIAQGFANLDAGERGTLLEEYVAEVKARRRQRDEAKTAA